MRGVLARGHTGFMVKNSLEGGFGATFHSASDKDDVTKIDNFVVLEHPGKQNLETKVVLKDLLSQIKKLLFTNTLNLMVLLLACGTVAFLGGH